MNNNESLERASNTVVPALEKMATPVARNPLRVPEVDTVKSRVRDTSPPLPVIDRPVEVIRQVRAASVPVQVSRQTEVSRIGNNSLAEYALLLGRLAVAELRIDVLEDDFPEDQKGGAGGGKSGVWSGYWWFGGQQQGPYDLTEIEGKYFGCNLRTGDVDFADEPTDTDNIEWRYVADKDEETGEYTLSNRTCGDIVFRIT
jgi:hypothetical protein